MKILNLYAGIGGNRQLWDGDISVTAVEYAPEIADVYADRFPDDTVVVGDALEYVQRNFADFDFIWASPPCPTHGQIRQNMGVRCRGIPPVIPDMTSLYGLIIFLKTNYSGLWCIENTKPYYEPLIPPSVILQRHLFWSSFPITGISVEHTGLRYKNKITDFDDAGLVAGTAIKNKRQVLRNCVDAGVGKHVLDCAREALKKGARL